MAEIYNPWQQPATDSDISFVTPEVSERVEHEHDSADAPEGELLAEALSVIDQQSRTIQKLMTLLTGEVPGAGDMG